MINTYDADNPVPMTERGYIYNVPNIESDEDEIASASAFRNAMKNAPDEQSAKEIFNKQFKEYNESIFNLIYNKIAGNKMKEDLNIIKKLAGLELSEDAPVEFDTPLSIKDVKFTSPSKSSAFMSIANRFPEGADVNDPEVKKEEFIKALLKSPLSLLSEINERISPADDNGLAVSTKLSQVIDNLGRDGDLKDLDESDKQFAIKIVKLAIDNMELEAGDDSPNYDELEQPEESVDLNDIRDDYGIEEEEEIQEGGDCYDCDGKDVDCKSCGGTGYVQFDDDPQEPSQEEIDKHEKAYKKYIGKHKKDESVSEDRDGPTPSEMSDEELMDFVQQKEEDLIDDIQQHIAPVHLHKENFEEMFEKYREEVLEPAAHDINMDHAMMNMDYDREEVDAEESIEDTSNKALEAAMEELKKLAGLELSEDDDEEKKEPCPKCGAERIMLKACASCGCS
jgi:hypothetical protein